MPEKPGVPEEIKNLYEEPEVGPTVKTHEEATECFLTLAKKSVENCSPRLILFEEKQIGEEPTEENWKKLVEEEAQRVGTVINLANETLKAKGFEKDKPQIKAARRWALSSIAALEASHPERYETPEEKAEHFSRREAQALLLAEIRKTVPPENFLDQMEIIGANLYQIFQQEVKKAEVTQRELFEAELVSKSAVARGLFFELVSHSIAPNDENLRNYPPKRGLPYWFEESRLLGVGAKIRNLKEGPYWRKGNMITNLVFKELQDPNPKKSPEFHQLKTQIGKEQILFYSPYINPDGKLRTDGKGQFSFDLKGEIKEAALKAGKLVICFNSEERRWVALNQEKYKQAQQIIDFLLMRANTANAKYEKTIHTPDHLLVTGEKRQTAIQGCVECKCYRDEEWRAVIELLEGQKDLSQPFLGGSIDAETLNKHRTDLGLKPVPYLKGHLLFELGVQLEKNYLHHATRGKLTNPVMVLRVPDTRRSDLMKDLQKQLDRRNLNVTIQQISLLSAKEIEEIALASITNADICESLEERGGELLKQAKQLEEEGKTDQAQKMYQKILGRNLSARALSLGILDLEKLDEVQKKAKSKEELPAWQRAREDFLGWRMERIRKLSEDFKLAKERGGG